ncbi:uncharacterized protein DFL_000755 [Arthrobotrys flagrans]|uniref:Asl1-like glycosyl hydrolase catalytic domain-containing protein n=1 Tax=Arthrobotrys flagrans TaxID=97331 RepID=A0A437AES6_ARTFL|nr:hypothetical protein DFL_000755 [Arthrobotrys flagrans]
MHISPFSILVSLPHLLALVSAAANPIGPNPNAKRGLVYVPSKDHPEDDKIWIQSGSPLTWYYNYESKPSPRLEGGSTKLQFVPMLWGDYDNTFVQDVKDLVDQGYDIEYVLGFNEPDNPANSGTGGSGVSPEAAAARWKESIEPLAEMGIRLGAPSVTGAPSGLDWLKAFFAACDSCTVDFIPLHWYGNFDGVASHLGTYSAAFPNMTFWFTEFALAHEDVTPSQEFFNLTMEYFDRLDNVGRYSWFGSFRSDVSNVGPNAALLNQDGGLTYIGAWYLNKDESKAASITGKGSSDAPALGASVMKSFGVTAFVAVLVSWVL